MTPIHAPTPASPDTTSSKHVLTQQYNLTVSSFKKLQSIEIQIVFLSRCLKEKVLPNSFCLPLKLQHLDQENLAKAKNTLKQTSRTLLRIALRSRKAEVINLNKVYWDNWHKLINLAHSQKEDDIENKLRNLESNITNKLTSTSQQKFNWLKGKTQQTNNEKTTEKKK